MLVPITSRSGARTQQQALDIEIDGKCDMVDPKAASKSFVSANYAGMARHFWNTFGEAHRMQFESACRGFRSGISGMSLFRSNSAKGLRSQMSNGVGGFVRLLLDSSVFAVSVCCRQYSL